MGRRRVAFLRQGHFQAAQIDAAVAGHQQCEGGLCDQTEGVKLPVALEQLNALGRAGSYFLEAAAKRRILKWLEPLVGLLLG